MFIESTQRKFWVYESKQKIVLAQKQANEEFVAQNKELLVKNGVSSVPDYLDYQEEKLLLKYYSKFLDDICHRFQPPVPLSVIGTAIMYFKRFFLHTSIMEYHPRDIAYLCVYLSCKVDEYNVSIDQFMGQVVSSPDLALQTFIIDYELLLLQKLNFHLTVHCPFRPVEGLIIDIKSKHCITAVDIEQYRHKTEKFLTNSLFSDVCLLHPPSQIALAALAYSMGDNFFTYLQLIADKQSAKQITEKIKRIQGMVLKLKFPSEEEVSTIEEKLNICRDNESNPYSSMYQQRQLARKEAKELEKKKKYQELYELQLKEEQVLGQSMIT